ncbi:MAG: DUF1566 domain-containing protein [Thermodesulfobacteriota bacterium]|nr:DUF1566 domain-containing protein [Thermodesulfobacteriota bacterium]
MKRKTKALIASLASAVLLLVPMPVLGGNLQPPGPPGPTTHTLNEIFATVQDTNDTVKNANDTVNHIPPAWSQILPANDGNSCNSSRFECVMDGEAVLDKETGLVWERTPEIADRWADACDYCYHKRVGGRFGWHLPTLEELASLLDGTHSQADLPNGHPFTAVRTGPYWSSTSDPTSSSDHAYIVSFERGFLDHALKTTRYNVWCVRGRH